MEDNYTFNVDIETQKSTTSVAQLRKEVRDLRDKLLNLDSTSQEYADTLQEVANKTNDLRELNQAIGKSAEDAGQKLANVTGTLKGISGAVQTVTAGLSLMGVEMGKDSELMKVLVSMMSMTQGLAAIESGVKSFARLTAGTKAATVAQKGLNLAVKAFPAVAIGAVIGFVVSKLIDWANAADDARQKQKELNDEILRQNQKQYEDDQNKALDEFLKGLARRRKELEADGKSRVEIERQVRREVQEEYDKQAEILRDNNKQYKQYLQARKQIEETYAKREREQGLSKREEKTLESTLESIDRAMDDASHRAVVASGAMNKLRDVITDLNLDIRILERNTKSGGETFSSTLKVTREELDAVTREARSFFSDIINGWDLVEKDTETKTEKIINHVDGLVTRLRAHGQDAEANLWEGWMIPSLDSDQEYNLQELEEIVKNTDVLSNKMSESLQGIRNLQIITDDEFKKLWKDALEGNEKILEEYDSLRDQYVQALSDANAPSEVIEAAQIDALKKHNEDMIQILTDRINFLKKFGTEEEKADITRLLVQKQALENQSAIYSNYIAAQQSWVTETRKIDEQYRKEQDSFFEWMWSQANEGTDIKARQLEEEIKYWEEIKNCSEEGSEQYAAVVEKITELTNELNNVKLDKLQKEWDKTNKAISKGYSLIQDSLSSLAALYQAQTDEAIAQLQDQLNQGQIDEKKFWEESEKLKEEEFYRQQNFQVAQAIMNGAAAIMQLFAEFPWPVATGLSVIMGGITAMQIDTIKAQKYHRSAEPGSSSGNGGSGENWINVAPAYQMNDGTNATTDRLDQISSNQTSQRVYILESDIQSSNRRVQVRESNTRF